jgi:hypothetical protein
LARAGFARVLGRRVVVRSADGGGVVCLVTDGGACVPLHAAPVSDATAREFQARARGHAAQLARVHACGYFYPDHADRIVRAVGTAIMYETEVDPRAVDAFSTRDGSAVIADALDGVSTVPDQVHAVQVAARVVLGHARHVAR